MKHLVTVTILLIFACLATSIAQPLDRRPVANILPKTTFLRKNVGFRDAGIKRLYGESKTITSLNGTFANSGDSSQYFYDVFNQVNERRNWTFDGTGWSLTSRTQFLMYDSSGNSLLEIFQITPDGGATWKNDERITQAYNTAGQNTAITIQYWSINDNAWQPGNPIQYEYDLPGNLIGSINGDYVASTLYTYNQDGLPVIITDRYKNSLDSVWHYFFQQFFAYDTVHPELPVYTTGSEFNDSMNAFYVVDSAAYFYDGVGNLIRRDFYNDNIFNDSLDCPVVYRLFQSFDNQNHLSQERYFVACQEDTLIGQLQSVIDHTYDVDGDPLYVLETEYYDTDTALYFTRYTYETVTRVQQPLQTFQFSFYPNPAADMIVLQTSSEKLQRVNIYDAHGRQAQTQALTGNETETLNLSGMPPGNYILQVIGKNGHMATRSFVIAK